MSKHARRCVGLLLVGLAAAACTSAKPEELVRSTSSALAAAPDSAVDAGEDFPCYPYPCCAIGYSVRTQHNDNQRTGEQPCEGSLSPSTVWSAFQWRASFTTHGLIYAQPLLAQGVTINGVTQDVLYVVDDQNYVYALNATTLAPVPGMANNPRLFEAPDTYHQAQSNNMGILSTPVISGNTMYLVAKADLLMGGAHHARFVLHVIDIRTLSEIVSRTFITATYNVPGGVDTFTPDVLMQRPGLLLNGNYLSIAFGNCPGSHQECNTINCPQDCKHLCTVNNCNPSVNTGGEGSPNGHGWVLTYNVSGAPSLTGVYLSSRVLDGTADSWGRVGIWQSGGGLAADSAGNVYFETGNGRHDANNDANSIIKLGSSGAFSLRYDVGTPWSDFLTGGDLDLASSGPVILPTTLSGSPPRILATGKQGWAYLTDQNFVDQGNFRAAFPAYYSPPWTPIDQTNCAGGNFGFICQTSTQNGGCTTLGQSLAPTASLGQECCYYGCANFDQTSSSGCGCLIGASNSGIWGQPVYWAKNASLFYWGVGDDLLQLGYNPSTGQIPGSPSAVNTFTSLPSVTGGFLGVSDYIGCSNCALLWAALPVSPTLGYLYAFDPTKTNAAPLWTATLNYPNDGSFNGNANFASPTIANGKVYLANWYYAYLSTPQGQVMVFY